MDKYLIYLYIGMYMSVFLNLKQISNSHTESYNDN